ncbi:MAG: hypothetical protein KJO21_04640 [Verrucomicrobiae bacterium]|nr:hypothetical protein [Verrucomicrobiae bacterium]NNJ43011.1 hypothetical protein [Akkermansiaceae bacterium]
MINFVQMVAICEEMTDGLKPLPLAVALLRAPIVGTRSHMGRLELYDLKKNPSESNNLAVTFPEKNKRLASQLDLWLESVDAQHMSPNPAYDRNSSKRGKKKRQPKKQK